MSELDLELVQRFTQQVRVRSVEVAQAELEQASLRLREDLDVQKKRTEARTLAAIKLRSANTRLTIAKWPVRFAVDPWIVAAVLAAVCGVLMGLFATVALRAPLWFALAFALSLPALFFVATPWFFSNLPKQETEVSRLALNHEAATVAEDAARATVKLSQQRQQSAKAIYDGLVQAREFPLNRLLATDLSAMTGTQFEEHLAEIFHFLGYHVRPTGQTGDQGVDLIIWRDQTRIAVQAKCYGGSVGNSAVQEVYSGMVFHQCVKCAVITTSEFTTSAKQLARATGCTLIDGQQLPLLIRGQISL